MIASCREIWLFSFQKLKKPLKNNNKKKANNKQNTKNLNSQCLTQSVICISWKALCTFSFLPRSSKWSQLYAVESEIQVTSFAISLHIRRHLIPVRASMFLAKCNRSEPNFSQADPTSGYLQCMFSAVTYSDIAQEIIHGEEVKRNCYT